MSLWHSDFTVCLSNIHVVGIVINVYPWIHVVYIIIMFIHGF